MSIEGLLMDTIKDRDKAFAECDTLRAENERQRSDMMDMATCVANTIEQSLWTGQCLQLEISETARLTDENTAGKIEIARLRHGCCEKMHEVPCDYSILQRQAAAMRGALEYYADKTKWPVRKWISSLAGHEFWDQETDPGESIAKQALSTTAGAAFAFLERLEAAEKVVEAVRERNRLRDEYRLACKKDSAFARTPDTQIAGQMLDQANAALDAALAVNDAIEGPRQNVLDMGGPEGPAPYHKGQRRDE
jgi:hypothetical protein